MDGIHAHLIQKSQFAKMTYTSELIPERDAAGRMCVVAFSTCLTAVPHCSPPPAAHGASRLSKTT